MLTGVILAGGKNQWLGKHLKSLLPFEGEKLINRQIREMRKVCQEIIVVTDEPKHYLKEIDYPIRIITDYVLGTGPLSGMYASFSLAKRDDLWVVGCGMPFISAKAAQWMLEEKQELGCDAVVPVLDGVPCPLHGVYDKHCVHEIRTMLMRQQYFLHDLLPLIQWEKVTETQIYEQGLDARFTLNLDTLEEYQAYQQRILEEN
jgi:molybdopterin-guanine dinucleotide biosynthesis protein A